VYLTPKPPQVPRYNREPRKAPRARQHKTYFWTEKFVEISDPKTLQQTPFASRCSPLRVKEDGKFLPIPNVTCEEVWKHGNGRTCHVEDRLYFSATDGTLPLLSDHVYTLALDPKRQCEGAMWLYPHDVARLSVPLESLQKMKNGAHLLRIAGKRMKGPEGDTGSIRVRVKVNDRVRLNSSVDLDRLTKGPRGWSITPSIKEAVTRVDVILTNDSDSFVLLTGAKLLEK
jgi:hypothetical protein